MKDAILRAAEEVATQNGFSCTYLLIFTQQEHLVRRYQDLFLPHPEDKLTSFVQQLYIEMRGNAEAVHQWRVLALCFFAAMQEEV